MKSSTTSGWRLSELLTQPTVDELVEETAEFLTARELKSVVECLKTRCTYQLAIEVSFCLSSSCLYALNARVCTCLYLLITHICYGFRLAFSSWLMNSRTWYAAASLILWRLISIIRRLKLRKSVFCLEYEYAILRKLERNRLQLMRLTYGASSKVVTPFLARLVCG